MTVTPSPQSVVVPVRGPGHCDDDAAWAEFVRQYDGQPRSRPDLTDFALANRVYMADRYDLDLIVWQTAAKERIRWLSIELAKAQAAPAPSSLAGGEVPALRAAYDRWVHEDAEAVEVIERVGVFLAALSPEAPARVDARGICEALGFDPTNHHNAAACPYCIPDEALRNEIKARALTPRHEAPAPRPELAPYTEDLKGIKAAMLADEAPAEGAGEFARQMEILRKAASVPVPDDDNDFTVEKARRGSESWRVIAANVLREYDRARSSAPEAREGELAGYANAEFMRRLKNWREAVPNTIRSDETFLKAVASESYPVALYTHPAAPSADRLRIAVEALLTLPELKRRQEYLRKGIGTATDEGKIVLQVLAALKAEGA